MVTLALFPVLAELLEIALLGVAEVYREGNHDSKPSVEEDGNNYSAVPGIKAVS